MLGIKKVRQEFYVKDKVRVFTPSYFNWVRGFSEYNTPGYKLIAINPKEPKIGIIVKKMGYTYNHSKHSFVYLVLLDHDIKAWFIETDMVKIEG